MSQQLNAPMYRSMARRKRSSAGFTLVDDPWGHTTDWRFGRGVPVHNTPVFDSGQPTIHGVISQTGVMVLGCL